MPSIASLSPRVLSSVSVKNIQPPSIYATNLVVHLDAGKTTSYTGSGTTWTDLSGNSNSFTLKKGQTLSSTTAIGPTYSITNSNYGMQFDPGGNYNTPSTQDGTNAQWLQGPDAVLNSFTNGTIEFWLQTLSKTRALDFRDGDGGTYINGVAYSHCLTSRQANGVYSHAIFSIGAYCNSAGQPAVGTAGKLYWHPTNGVTPAASTGTISNGTAYQVVVTFSSSNCKFYINGTLDSTTSGNYSVPSAGLANYGTTIGTWPASGFNEHQFAGSIYNVKAYNTQLNDSQVLQNYRAVKGRFGL